MKIHFAAATLFSLLSIVKSFQRGFRWLSIFAGSTLWVLQALGNPSISDDSLKNTIGPARGALVLTGGAMHVPSLKKFIELTGKTQPVISVITTASPDEKQSGAYYKLIRDSFERAGTRMVRILHTRDTAKANSDEFLKYLRDADGVWFTGGRQWRLADAYLNTRVMDELRSLLNRAGVVGGNSAGATIMGSFLVRGDTSSAEIMEGSHRTGFGFVRNCAIDQHLLTRNRQFDMFEILKNHSELLGIGIDERTSVIIRGNDMLVFGVSYVAIYDGTTFTHSGNKRKTLRRGEERFYFLKNGDHYDLLNRTPVFNGKQ